MSEAKSFASLSPSLLARKGAARPAMRPQLAPLTFEEANPAGFDAGFDDQNALGWNDMGDDDVVPAVALAPVDEPANSIPRTQPEVLRQIETLATAINGKAAPREAAPLSAGMIKMPRRNGSALEEGRKAAFTLRLDAERHFRLRLACTLENRSAQQVVVQALDAFLESMPGLDSLARRARQS
ncbi:MAG: hypothetical protein B7Z39_01280 [Novosphingobium sp. 12-64-8]|nr:MAG: hypothetical protein B7Z39_01280 [Novosphingobium sp. 12-64-8]